MKEKEFLYDAFISYRHGGIDQFVAETIHKKLEAYRPPAKIVNNPNCTRKRIKRVFRDSDELQLVSNLEEHLVETIKKSEFLIVICTPRLRESEWCKKEIQTFIETYGKRNVLAVLAEGEPAESFPEELLYEDVTKVDAAGNTIVVKRPVEPLAADVRGKNHNEMKKAMKTELLRLMAPMFGVDYDALRRRHKEKQTRKAIMISSSVALVSAGFAVYTGIMGYLIKEQNKKIEEQANNLTMVNAEIQTQKMQLEQQAKQIAKSQAVYLADKAKSLRDEDFKKDSVYLAYQALTTYDGVEMPETPEAIEALTYCLDVYGNGKQYLSKEYIELSGGLKQYAVSYDETTLVILDENNVLSLWDIQETRELWQREISLEIMNGNIEYLGFDTKGNVVMHIPEEENEILKYDKETGELIQAIPSLGDNKCKTNFGVSASKFRGFFDGEYCYILNLDTFEIYTQKKIGDTNYENESTNRYEFYSQNIRGRVTYTIDDRESKQFWEWDVFDNRERFLFTLEMGDVWKVFENDGMYYVVGRNRKNSTTGYEIVSVNTKEGEEEVCVTDIDNLFAKELVFTSVKTDNTLWFINTDYVIVFDADTGKQVQQFMLSKPFIGTAFGGDYLHIYLQSGLRIFSMATYPFAESGIWEGRSSELSDLIVLKNGTYLGIKADHSALILYEYPNEGETVDNILGKNKDGKFIYGDANELREACHVTEKGVPTGVMKFWDDRFYLSYYEDGSIIIYDAGTGEQISKYKEDKGLQLLDYGKIGEYYLVSTAASKGLLFNKDGYLCGIIPSFDAISNENGMVYILNREDKYRQVPIYTKDELLQIAREYLIQEGFEVE